MRRVTLVVLVLSCSSGPSAEECATISSQGRAFTSSVIDKNAGVCTTDSECVTVRAMIRCYTGCPRAISRGRETPTQSDVAGVEDSVCGTSSCMVNEGCEPVHAACVEGRCRTAAGAGTGDGGSPDGG